MSKSPRLVRLPVDLDVWNVNRPAGTTDPAVLVVGRIEPRKGPETVVEAAALLGSEIAGLKVRFVGSSSGERNGLAYGEWVRQLARNRGVSVEFVPHRQPGSLASMYADARVIAVPSQFESFSMTLVEAMASRRPVVYTSQVGAGEIVTGTGGGTMIPPGDAAALATALRPYLTEPRLAERAGDIGREVVERHCRPELIAAQRESCYEEAIDIVARRA
jgi:glycosyltransferase involved in cell wall biosynthesis